MAETISTLGLQLINNANLQAGQLYLSTLTQQLTTGKVSQSLAEFSAGDAQNLLNLTGGVTQQKAFASVATTLTPRIQVYDSSLTGIEDIASQAASIVSGNPTYNPEHSGSVATQMQGFMQQVSYYLNQQVNGRYIFAGSRYNTVPVGDITTLGKPTAADATALAANVSANILPAYDAQADQTAQLDIASGSMILSAKTSGTFGNGIGLALAAGTTSGTKATISVAGQADEVYDNIAGSGATFWANLETAINAGSRLVTAEAGTVGVDPTLGASYTLSGGTGSAKNNVATATIGTNDITFDALDTGLAGNSITVTIADGTTSGKKVTITDGTTTETYDNIAGSGATLWTNVAAAVNGGGSALVMATAGGGTGAAANGTTTLAGGADPANTAAYALEQVAISTTQTLKYGINSNQTGFQQLILGLRFAYAATQDTTNYASNMTQATSLITDGLRAIRGIHTGLSSNNSTLTSAQDSQATTINALQTQLGDIQNVDVNAVAVKIQSYQSQLQASYAATAIMQKLSILNYL